MASPVPPTPTTGGQIRWEPFTGPARVFAAGGAAVLGEDGWVVLASPDIGGGANFSADGTTWIASPLRDTGRAQILRVAANATAYLIIGVLTTELPGTVFESDLLLWRSSDGRTWERSGELPLGPSCDDIRCAVDTVALAPSGAIFVGVPGSRDDRRDGPRVSEDGVDWRLVKPAAFGVDALAIRDVDATDSEVVLAGNECQECPSRLWTSRDGSTWSMQDADGLPFVRTFSVARIGERVVAAILGCPDERTCGLELWMSEGGGSWERTLAQPDVVSPDLAAVGDTFMVVGRDRSRPVILASTDGRTWTEVDQAGLGWADECHVSFPWLAGGARPMFLVGSEEECAVWRGLMPSA
jgi:hypothetical protein